jgi:hypothetical protein
MQLTAVIFVIAILTGLFGYAFKRLDEVEPLNPEGVEVVRLLKAFSLFIYVALLIVLLFLSSR